MAAHPTPRVILPIAKLTVRLDASASTRHGTESLWAEDLGDGTFRIANVPYFARGLSFDDIVRARPSSIGFEITEVQSRGGHSTYRFFLADPPAGESWLSYWLPLERLGCTYECATKRLFAVDVPPSADIHHAFGLLELGEKAGVWEFEEGHCGHLA